MRKFRILYANSNLHIATERLLRDDLGTVIFYFSMTVQYNKMYICAKRCQYHFAYETDFYLYIFLDFLKDLVSLCRMLLVHMCTNRLLLSATLCRSK